jgi:hypothetical protein
MSILRYAALAGAFAVTACAQSSGQPVASADYTAAARAHLEPTQGHVFACIDNTRSWTGTLFEVEVDGRNVGGMDANDCMALDLPPGQHAVRYVVHTILGRPEREPPPKTVTLAPGASDYLTLGYRVTPPPFGQAIADSGLVGQILTGFKYFNSPPPTSATFEVTTSNDGTSLIAYHTLVMPTGLPAQATAAVTTPGG